MSIFLPGKKLHYLILLQIWHKISQVISTLAGQVFMLDGWKVRSYGCDDSVPSLVAVDRADFVLAGSGWFEGVTNSQAFYYALHNILLHTLPQNH